jgi:hypothetical protein
MKKLIQVLIVCGLFVFMEGTASSVFGKDYDISKMPDSQQYRICECIGMLAGYRMQIKGIPEITDSKELGQQIDEALKLQFPTADSISLYCVQKKPKIFGYSMEASKMQIESNTAWSSAIDCTLDLVEWKLMVRPDFLRKY